MLSTSIDSMNKEPSIVIIGAGISGLAAADQLINHHKFQNVTILEALDRVGGRIHPVAIDDTNYIHLGGQWLHGRDNALLHLAVQLGLIPNKDAPPDDIYSNMRFIDQNGLHVPKKLRDDFIEFAGDCFGKMGEKKFRENYDPSNSYGDVMDDLYQKFLNGKENAYCDEERMILDAMFAANKASLEQYYGVSLHHLNAQDIADNSDDSANWPISISMKNPGYKAILDEMIRRVPSDRCIQFNSRVRCIRWNDNTSPEACVAIELENDQSISADHVITTCSLGHLKHFGYRLFDPPLPQSKQEVIKNVGFGVVDRLYLVFDQPYWPSDTGNMNLIRVGGDIAPGSMLETELTRMMEVVVASNSPAILMIWISPQHASLFESSTDQEILEAAMTTLRKYLNNPSLPTPRMWRSSWLKDPLFCGTFSYNAMNCRQIPSDRSALMEPLMQLRGEKQVPAVLFAGEATSSFHFATVHGAFATGIREADRLARYHTNR